MAITIGQKLGLYEITAFLGAGGMGQVYRARDTALQRDVALKLLPDAFASDSDRLTRFQREAQLLASLNHPNIAAIYGLEMSQPAQALVMELVEGPTLAERIAQGPIPIDETLAIARQLAEALEYAHETGVMHRDLKPTNIKLTPDGRLKVLDFGLAKALGEDPRAATMSNSPTLSLAATQAGVILGTAAYMSPEQAKGKTADRRADIWAFGVVVFEMLTGKMMFSGETAAETMAQVMIKDPRWDALPANTPPRLREMLRRCLVKDPRNRVRDMGDVRIAIEDIIANPESNKETATDTKQEPMQVQTPGRGRLGMAVGIVLGAVLASGAILWTWAPWRAAPPSTSLRLSAELGADAALASSTVSTLALSPDGQVLAFVGVKDEKTQLYVRRLGQLQATPLAGSEDAAYPFFSPDGKWIGFFANGKLKKISATGGAGVTLADAPGGRGGTWSEDGNIIFSPNVGAGVNLMRVSAGGGKVEAETTLAQGESVHRLPQVLPEGKGLLYTASPNNIGMDDANIVVQPLPKGTPKVLVRGGYYGRYVRSGHIVYIHGGTLFAVPFDSDRLELTGPAVPAVEEVSSGPGTNNRAQFAISENGTFVYLPGQTFGAAPSISWLDRTGKISPLRSAGSEWADPQFAPDGQKIAIDINDGKQTDVWIYEWLRDTLTRFTFDPSEDRKPVWTPDGRRIAFSSAKLTGNLYWRRSDGTGEVQRLTDGNNLQYPGSFHPSGKYLAFEENTQQTGTDLMILPIEGDEGSGWKPGKPTVFLNTPANETEPIFSPDGRWIAYSSSESGRREIFVRPFPGPGGKWQISSGGGTDPTWSRTRHELFYRSNDGHIMVCSYSAEGDSFKAEKPRVWSERITLVTSRYRNLDLHPDGERFAVSVATESENEAPHDKVVFIFNFFDELRRIAPPSKK